MDDIELAKLSFHQNAIQSYLAARMMVSTNHLAPIGFYNAHLACECMLKSLTAQCGIGPKFGHDLSSLLSELTKVNSAPELNDARLVTIFEWLNPYQELGRYGALARAQHDPDRKDEPNIKAYGVIGYQSSGAIKDIDYAFNLLYELSDIPDDLIKQIRSGTSPTSWNFPISLQEVLFAGNSAITPPVDSSS